MHEIIGKWLGLFKAKSCNSTPMTGRLRRLLHKPCAKADGLRLVDYIHHLLSVLPERFEADPVAEIDDLLPCNDGMKGYFATP